jgi:kinesin family protein 1
VGGEKARQRSRRVQIGEMSENVRVAVRARPLNSREKGLNARNIVSVSGPSISLEDPETKTPRPFAFDFAYGPSTQQSTVWADIGEKVLEGAWAGYNSSLFAYGQTGSGKSYSMVGGDGESRGIVPRACEAMFARIDADTDPATTFKVEVSMLEIYMEKIKDLLAKGGSDSLQVRQHPKTGFYVEGLSKSVVGSYAAIARLMEVGTEARTVAATNMNATSSRAHTIFAITLTQTIVDSGAGKATDRTSIINLIDLAGSERQASTGATGNRLKEGAAINQSLTSLGNVIAALAHNADPANAKKQRLVPYRDSVLTMLLQNALGGNAKTIMIAAISPADVNFEETVRAPRGKE